jgi:hypothetical protein
MDDESTREVESIVRAIGALTNLPDTPLARALRETVERQLVVLERMKALEKRIASLEVASVRLARATRTREGAAGANGTDGDGQPSSKSRSG